MTYQIRSLHEDELCKWLHFLADDVFKGIPLSCFTREWDSDPSRDISSIFVAVDAKERIVSGGRVFIREIYLNGETVKAGGIGSFGTRKRYRGKGISTALLTRCIAFMQERDMPVSYLLCGDHNEKYYNRFGYQSCQFLKKISKIGVGISYKQAYTIRNIDFTRDAEAVSAMHKSFCGNYNGSAIRSEDYWKRWIASCPFKKYFIAEDDQGRPIAYINAHLDGTRLCVYDFAYMQEYYDIFDSLVSKVSAEIASTAIDVKYQVPIYSYMPVEEHTEDCLIMYKLIKPFYSQSKLIGDTDELVATLRGSGNQSRLLLWEVDDI